MSDPAEGAQKETGTAESSEATALLAPAEESALHRAWPWLVLTFAAVDVISLGGKRRAFGAFVSQLSVEFNGTIPLPELNWIGDSYSAVGYLTVGASTALVLAADRRYRLFTVLGAFLVLASCVASSVVPNPHWLFLTHTLVHGLGSSLLLSVIGLIVSEYFPDSHRFRLLATTLVSGGSLGSIIFVELYALMIQELGWRLAFIVLGAVYFVILAAGAIVFKRSPHAPPRPPGLCGGACEGAVSLRRMPLLLLWIVDRVLTSVVTYGLLMNLTDFARRAGNTLVHSALLTTLFTVGEASTYVIGAAVTAATKDFFKDRLRFILLGATAVMAVSLSLMGLLIWSPTAGYVLAFISGFALGPSITFLFPAGQEMTTLRGEIAYPFTLGGMGLGMMLSPFLSAEVALRFSYQWFFLTQGGLTALKFLALLVATIYLGADCHKDPKEKGKEEEEKEEKKE